MTSIKYLNFKYLREIVIWQNLNTARYGFTEKGMLAPKHLPFKSSETAEKAARSLAKQLKAVSCKELQVFTSDRPEFGYIPELEGFQVGDMVDVEGYDRPGCIGYLDAESKTAQVLWDRAMGFFKPERLSLAKLKSPLVPLLKDLADVLGQLVDPDPAASTDDIDSVLIRANSDSAYKLENAYWTLMKHRLPEKGNLSPHVTAQCQVALNTILGRLERLTEQQRVVDPKSELAYNEIKDFLLSRQIYDDTTTKAWLRVLLHNASTDVRQVYADRLLERIGNSIWTSDSAIRLKVESLVGWQ